MSQTPDTASFRGQLAWAYPEVYSRRKRSEDSDSGYEVTSIEQPHEVFDYESDLVESKEIWVNAEDIEWDLSSRDFEFASQNAPLSVFEHKEQTQFIPRSESPLPSISSQSAKKSRPRNFSDLYRFLPTKLHRHLSAPPELDLDLIRSSLNKRVSLMSASMAAFLKLTLVGDGGVGKSCLILQYMYGDFVEEYEPTKADAYRRTITLQGDEVQIDILDTAGQEDYPAVRDGYLKHGDGFLLVFDLTNRETFESIRNHSSSTNLNIRENVLRVKSDDPQLPVILIGNKSDLASARRVSTEEAAGLAASWGMAYTETSAKTRENVDRAFSEIFVKIKELKSERQRLSSQSGKNGGGGAKAYPSSNMTREEEEAVRADSMRKRIKKWFSNRKKQCVLS